MPNVFRPEWDAPDPSKPEPYTNTAAQVGAQAGAERIGASVYELKPGEATWPFHYHQGNEELLIVLAGRPTLRTFDGERELEPGELVAFRTGPDGAHRLDNRTDEPARVLIIGTLRSPEVVVYPDSDKIGARAWGGAETLRKNFRSGDAVDYWEGEA